MKSANLMQTAIAMGVGLVLFSLPSPILHRDYEPPLEGSRLRQDRKLVSLSVAVTDQKGKEVTGLQREDFKVYENGLEQAIDSFNADDLPISWGLVLDRSNVGQKTMWDVYHAAFHIIHERADRDEAFIVTFADQIEEVSGFTSNYGELLNALRRVRPGRQAALYDAVVFALDQMKQSKNRKKALVVVTESADDSSQTAFRQLIERAKREDVLIYTVGLTDSLRLRPLGNKDRKWRQELNKLAEATGAYAHFPNNLSKCEEMMKSIIARISRLYRIEYRSSYSTQSGEWRNVLVEVKQRDNKTKYIIHTRAGFYAQQRK